MEFLYGTLCLIVLVFCYFFIGIILKFIVGWWILIVGIPITIYLGFKYGLIGSIVALFSLGIFLGLNNLWHDCRLFLYFEKVLDKIFYMSDT